MPKPRLTVHLHNEAPTGLVLEDLAGYLRTRWPALGVATGFWPPHGAVDRLAPVWAKARIHDPRKPWTEREPLPMELAYERRRFRGDTGDSFGLLYDGIRLVQAFWGLLPREERSASHLHVVFTNQLVGTWDEATGRYHAHAAVFAVPCLISTTGMVEAPARPREYYWIKHSGFGPLADGLADQFLDDNAERVVRHGDGRLTEIVKGYVVQAIMYHLNGEPFCRDPGCRLYDARWQQELIAAQLRGSEFCAGHRALLEELIGSGRG